MCIVLSADVKELNIRQKGERMKTETWYLTIEHELSDDELFEILEQMIKLLNKRGLNKVEIERKPEKPS